MAVKMRLMRMGKKRTAYYRVVVIDGRSPRDGRYIDQIGVYDPSFSPSKIEIDNEKALTWLSKGAQPTEPVRKLLEISGAMSKHKVATGKIHTISGPAPVSEPLLEEPDSELSPEPMVAEAETESPEPMVVEAETASADEPTAIEAEADANLSEEE